VAEGFNGIDNAEDVAGTVVQEVGSPGHDAGAGTTAMNGGAAVSHTSGVVGKNRGGCTGCTYQQQRERMARDAAADPLDASVAGVHIDGIRSSRSLS